MTVTVIPKKQRARYNPASADSEIRACIAAMAESVRTAETEVVHDERIPLGCVWIVIDGGSEAKAA